MAKTRKTAKSNKVDYKLKLKELEQSHKEKQYSFNRSINQLEDEKRELTKKVESARAEIEHQFKVNNVIISENAWLRNTIRMLTLDADKIKITYEDVISQDKALNNRF